MERYNHLNSYLKDEFGERVLKVCIDGGFTCPNRDGSKGVGGCIFCGEEGAGENIKGRCVEINKSIVSQVETFLKSYRGERANKFIAYFQSFSNTYADVKILKERYDIALGVSDKIIGLQVATRPDLITNEIVELLSSYKDRYYVCVELGLQTANDDIGEKLNRGYSTRDFVEACEKLKKKDIDIVAHLMIGLPNEKEEDIIDTVKLINYCGCKGIKIHGTYVVEGSTLAEIYRSGEYSPITQEYYVDQGCRVISHLRKDIIIHRINADPPKEKLIAPNWSLKKKIVINAINKRLEELDIFQGKDVV